ncbi:UDP-glycosyltransferase-like protein [Striga asiatica]|uniref:Glycosyltransferase n=1 Tax=Striga asiatica TaxID=4170 RepID=A0A5A7QLP6_STRAF|nr:UDP-glycosyltransferase-like protein [Striga asiatica]
MANRWSPHVALFPCSGMGHLLPFLRLAATLSSRGCHVTLITVHPTVSSAESTHLSAFLSSHPKIATLPFHLLPHRKSHLTTDDPFFIQMDSINASLHLLPPLLSAASPPLSAIVADFPVTATLVRLTSHLPPVSLYSLLTTSARFVALTLTNHLPHLDHSQHMIQIPGIGPMPVSNIPPAMLDKSHFFGATISSNNSSLRDVKAVLINTFTWFEHDAIRALTENGPAQKILPIGPLEPFETGPAQDNITWLDGQADGSVVFVSFGSRTALTADQTRELAHGLEISGPKFLWVLKSSKVDKEDAGKPEDLLGESFLRRIEFEGKGMVVKGWVDQERILAHPAVGGFVSHCGWNSVVEAARLGVPVLAWPQHGDQRVNAEVVEKVGLGIWDRDWGWIGEKLVGRNEIADKIRELMVNNKELRVTAKEIKERALEAMEEDGSSDLFVREFIESLQND